MKYDKNTIPVHPRIEIDFITRNASPKIVVRYAYKIGPPTLAFGTTTFSPSPLSI